MSAGNSNALGQGVRLKGAKNTYIIEKVLGQGGFGITYKASAMVEHEGIEHEMFFTIKEHFLSDFCERDSTTNRVHFSAPTREKVTNSLTDFIAEARRLQSIKHPNIVRVSEVFEANDTAYYVMEYIKGDSLRSHIEKNGALSESQALTVIAPILNAVNYLHQNRLTHLDIKPDNIMLKPGRDGELIPVLIDFGLSKHYDESGKATSTVRTLGCSDGYAPPEQYAGIITFTPQADVYALGATLFYLLTGEQPDKSTEIDDDYVVKNLPTSISETTRNAICGAMHQLRKSRTQTVVAFGTSLGIKVDTSGGASGSSISTSSLTQPVVKKKEMPGKDDTEIIGTNPKPSSKRWLTPLLIGLVVLAVGFASFFAVRGIISDDDDDTSSVADTTKIEGDSTVVAPTPVPTPGPVVDDDGYSAAYSKAYELYQKEKYEECKRECKSLLRTYTKQSQKEQLNLLITACDQALSSTGADPEGSNSTTQAGGSGGGANTGGSSPAGGGGTYSSSASAAQRAAIDELLASMVWVAGGTYTMGATSEQGSDAWDDEKPAHSETVGGFYLCKYEVTQKLWSAVMGSNPSNWKGDNLPVEMVSWNDCITFIDRLNELTNNKYGFRLPTEAEWEYAARGGNRSRGYKYSGSDNIGQVAWYYDNTGSGTHAVGGKSPNELGLYDMSGNVWEWTSSKWCDNYNSPRNSSNRVYRGGSWYGSARDCRESYRGSCGPGYSSYYLGLRLARRP